MPENGDMTEKLREISAEELTKIIQEVFEQGGEFTLRVTGMSMYPTLCHLRDSVRMVSASIATPKNNASS